MIAKTKEREKAIELRRQGRSYSEILRKIPVSKSTLSLWLRSVNLARPQVQRLTEKRRQAALKGAQKRHLIRLQITAAIKKEAHKDIGRISRRELWLMGIMLYWAEGAKEKEWAPGSGVEFINSDPYMIKLFLKWLVDIVGIAHEQIKFEIYIHKNHQDRLFKVRQYWSRVVGMPLTQLETVYFKRHRVKTNRKNIGDNYYGILKICIRASSTLNRKIAGWVEGICRQCNI